MQPGAEKTFAREAYLTLLPGRTLRHMLESGLKEAWNHKQWAKPAKALTNP